MRLITPILLLVILCVGQTVQDPALAAEPIKVDRLVSRRHQHQHQLEARDQGYSNGGNALTNGRGEDGQLRNSHNFEISFYHLNDIHSHLDEYRPNGAFCMDPIRGCVGGYSRLKALIDEMRPQKKNSLFLNAGDEFQGTLYYSIFKGEKIADTLNQLGFDAMTLGNHEFDDGDDLISEFISNLTFPVISSNIHTSHPKLAKGLIPYKIFHKHQLAVLDLTTEETASTSNPSNLTKFEDPVQSAQRTVKLINKLHPNIKRIVALTHIGYEQDIVLAKNTTGISLIIGGHSHTLLGNDTGAVGAYPTIAENKNGDEVFIVTAHRWGERLGYIDVEYDRHGKIVSYEGAPFHLTNATKEDAGLKAQVTGWAQSFEEFNRRVIGFTASPLDRSICQEGECTLGDVTAGALHAALPDTVGGIMNSGGMRTDIAARSITARQPLECFPFGNSLTELDFTGSELWDTFEGIVSHVNVNNGLEVTSFAQVSSSIRFTYNPQNPVGSRLITLTIGGQSVSLSQTYTIATIDFLAQGGDNFWPARSGFITLDTIDEAWTSYIQAHSPLDIQLDGRIATTEETVPQKLI